MVKRIERSSNGRHLRRTGKLSGKHDRAVAIFTIGADGTDLRALTGGTELNHMPRWSHDGIWVYFVQIRPELSFRRVPALGGASEFVLPVVWETHNFDVSRDDRIVWGKHDAGRRELWSARVR